jgi:hypothetical protein
LFFDFLNKKLVEIGQALLKDYEKAWMSAMARRWRIVV